METFNEEIVRVALKYVGQEEVGNNWGWKDKMFEKAMRAVGWANGWAWCASFVRMVYLEAAEKHFGKESPHYERIKATLKHGVVATYRAMLKSAYFKVSMEPKPGGVIMFDYGEGKGHTGIELNTEGKGDHLVEGNTNKKGQREGKWVMVKERILLATGKRYLGCGYYIGAD